MSRHYEIDEDTAQVKEKFVADPEDENRVKDYCPLCIETGPYLMIYGKDEAGFPVKQCPQCKMILPMGIAGRIDPDLTTSQTSKGKLQFRGLKLSELVKKQETKQDPFF